MKPIDWENYNDVYTVYWNCYSCCDEISENEGRTVKMSGWKAWSDKAFLCDDAKYADKELGSAAYPCIAIECDLPEFQAKLDSCDLTKKCFVEGKIFLRKVKYPSGCAAKPIIKITNIDDIYFEK
ncbi:MAG: hypothetical protein LBH82_00840 [Bacteroidales bacterium]|nr:hypothetical protein [Bacteroidales bacterium]